MAVDESNLEMPSGGSRFISGCKPMARLLGH
jgi:hypothetical protein